MICTGSKIIIEALKEQNVSTVFGYPGGQVVNIYDELYAAADSKHVTNKARRTRQTAMRAQRGRSGL